MKVSELLFALQNADPEMTVCQFTESGPQEVTEVAVYRGGYEADNSPKLNWRHESGQYVGLGWPGDFDATSAEESCMRVKELIV